MSGTVLGENRTIKGMKEAYLDPSKKAGQDVNTEYTNNIYIFHHQNARQNTELIKPLTMYQKFTYVETTNQICVNSN